MKFSNLSFFLINLIFQNLQKKEIEEKRKKTRSNWVGPPGAPSGVDARSDTPSGGIQFAVTKLFGTGSQVPFVEFQRERERQWLE
jgi:hypothetical protein